MRKLIILLIFLMQISIFADGTDLSEDQLVENFVHFVLDNQQKLQNDGYESEYLCMSNIGFIYPKAQVKYDLALKANHNYVFYVMTDGPIFTVYCMHPDKSSDSELSPNPSNRVVFHFRPESTGVYWFFIITEEKDIGGMYIAYFTSIKKMNGVKEK